MTQGPLLFNLVCTCASVAVVVLIVYLVERFTTRRKLNYQKIILDMACFNAATLLCKATDSALNWHGDYTQAMYIVFVILSVGTGLFGGWTYPGESKKSS